MAIICPDCQTENTSSQVTCLSCGNNLNTTVAVSAVEETNKDSVMSENPDIQDNLDQTQMIDNEDFVEPEIEAQDNPVDDDVTHATTRVPNMNDEDGLLHIGSVRFRGNLVLKDKEDGTVYRIENDQLSEAVVGRYNAQTDFHPQIDFTEKNGKKRGVSRRHATINQRGDLIFVTDHNSLNGTYLNGQRLVPEQSRVMRDSDSLRIGHISLIVLFEDIE